MNLSENFTLEEMLSSQTATRLGISEQFTPSKSVVDNLQTLCNNILQPLREMVGHSLHISSGYRCLKVNQAVGGVGMSQHTLGLAADVEDFENGNAWLFRKMLESGLKFDQIIWEYGDEKNPSWVHVSFNSLGNREEILKINKQGTTKHTKEEALKWA